MNDLDVLKLFAERYVCAEYRERFVQDAVKKPGRLYEKICHSIGEVFNPSFKGGACAFHQSKELCWVFRGGAPTKKTWQEASVHMGLGEGLLVVGCSGVGFYAETESAKGSPSVVYAAGG